MTIVAQAKSAWTNFEQKNIMCVMRTGFANGVNQGIGNNAYTAVAFTTELYDVNGDFVSNDLRIHKRTVSAILIR